MATAALAGAQAAPARAADDPPDPRALEFIRELTQRIEPIDGSLSVATRDGKIAAGYYRLTVKRTGDQNMNANLCKAAVRAFSTSQPLDWVFDR